MEFDIIDLYKVFAIIDIFLVIRKIIFIKRKVPNVTYYALYFFVPCAILGFLYTLTLFLVAEFSNPPMPPLMEMEIEHRILWISFLLINFCITVMLFVLSRKYATFHIVYYPKKRRKPKVVNVEESYIIRHKLFGDQTILVRDIIPEESFYYMIDGKESKLFPYAQLLGSEEYMTIKLKNGKKVKIQSYSVFLSASSIDTLSELYDLAKALNIEVKYTKD